MKELKKTFIIAEAGVNHNGDLSLAKDLIAIASESGADAVKFQSFNADNLVVKKAPKAKYQLAATSPTESQYTMLKKLELSPESIYLLNEYAKQKKILFLSTPFDINALHFLAKELNMPMIKIASGEITNAPLLHAVAQTQKKIILSTGMSTLAEIEFALNTIGEGYDDQKASSCLYDISARRLSPLAYQKLKQNVTLLHCTTDYPAPFQDVNLKAISTLRHAFHLPVGYSDHTLGIEVAIAAVALGAKMIEKHFTIDKKLSGPDHLASLMPEELSAMINCIRHVEISLGDGKKLPTPSELSNRLVARRSLVALCEIHPGEEFTKDNLGLKRPGDGISGYYYWEWLGKKATQHYLENDMIKNL